MILKTSAEWMSQYKDDFTIYDPDGWDRKNYEYSWFIEKIPFREFQSRVLRSTLVYKDGKKGLFPVKK